VTIAPRTPDTALISTGRGLLRTANVGASWTTVAQGSGAVHFDPSVGTRAYFCGSQQFGTSSNKGATFTISSIPALRSCHRLVVAGSTFFAVGSGPLFKSTDSGATWSAIGAQSFDDVALADAAGNVIVAGAGNGIYRSTDGGTTFRSISGRSIDAVVADPAAPAHVIAAGFGIFASTDAGASFVARNNGLPASIFVRALSIVGSRFYAVGAEGGSDQVWTSGTPAGLYKSTGH
jgi:hypothetical protein